MYMVYHVLGHEYKTVPMNQVVDVIKSLIPISPKTSRRAGNAIAALGIGKSYYIDYGECRVFVKRIS